MSEKNFPEVIKEIHHKDDRFGKGAYYFIREALDHTLKNLEKSNKKNKGHVSGIELLNGIRDYALDRFGPMTMTLMEHWNISKCRRFWRTRIQTYLKDISPKQERLFQQGSPISLLPSKEN